MNKQQFAIGLFIIMLAGLFWSRAVLSISQGVWVLFVLFAYKEWGRLITKDSLLVWSFCPLGLFLLGWYQHPASLPTYDFLLTLSVYPIAALTIKSLSSTTGKWLVIVWQFATVVGLLYPVTWYFFHINEAHIAYKEGRSLPTFMDTDHIRFSIFLCCTIILSNAYKQTAGLAQKIGMSLLFFFLILLSVRSVWLILACMGITGIILHFRLISQLSFYKRIGFLALLVAIPFLAYLLFPTMQEKIAYTLYDWQQYEPGKYNPTLSDGARIAVNQTALHAIMANGANTGWAGIAASMKYYFSLYFPGTPLQYGWPFNQWLFWWMGSGFWGMLLFTAWLIYPIWYGWKEKNNGLIYWTVAIIASCFVESTLALQYGVFLHAWPTSILWANNQLKTKEAA